MDQLDFSHKRRPVRASDALIVNVGLDDPEMAVLTGSVNSRTAPASAYEADELERMTRAFLEGSYETAGGDVIPAVHLTPDLVTCP
jgi:hypothetical protein